MPYYPPDEPRQLQEGRLYMSRLRDGSEIELHFRDDRQADPFELPLHLGAPARNSVSWRSTAPTPDRASGPPSSLPWARAPSMAIQLKTRGQVACKPEDFGFAYLSDEWQKSSLMATCYRAGLSALRVSDRSHGYYRCSVSYQNSTLVEQFRLGFSADLSLKAKPQGPLEPAVDFTKNSSVCLGGRLELDCVVSPAAASVVLARVYEPQLDAFGEIVKYNKVDHLLAYWYPKGLESNSSKAASVTVGSRDIRVKLVMDSVTADQDGYYICAAEAKGFRRPALKIFSSRHCVVGEAASRLSAVADFPCGPSPDHCVLRRAAGLAASLIIGALIFIYYFAKRRTAPIKKRLVCVDNSELRRRPAPAAEHASTSQASTVTASDTAAQLLCRRFGWSASERPDPCGGFGSRRAGQDDEGEGSTSTKINREVRYVIPSCPVLEVDRKTMFRLLGEGAFGSVHSGQLLVGNKPKDVAANYSEEELVALFKEMEIMKLMSPESASQHHQTGWHQHQE
uniref:Ig-like domain-containing protein n=1 Tax=Macrostomum lignano TaxID=282301 RepID=A0A1I8FAV5_9PLAT